MQRKLYITLTAVAVLFHLIGLAGIGMLHHAGILRATPYHLLLMFGLLLLSYKEQWQQYALWWIPAFVMGFMAEWAGVHKGWLFGSYVYTNVLGLQLAGIPLLIGCNWVVVMTGAISLALLLKKNIWVTAALAATIATLYDWILEPVAMHLGYWNWQDGIVPLYNYASWWAVSYLMAAWWPLASVRPNKFGITLFIIQLVFFIVLRILL